MWDPESAPPLKTNRLPCDLFANAEKNQDVSEKFAGKVIRCRHCGIHLTFPASELEPRAAGSDGTPVAGPSIQTPANPQPGAQAGWADFSLPDKSGQGALENSPSAYPHNSQTAGALSPQTPSSDFLPVDNAPPQMNFPAYAHPKAHQGACTELVPSVPVRKSSTWQPNVAKNWKRCHWEYNWFNGRSPL